MLSMNETRKLFEAYQRNLNEGDNLDWFKNEGLTIARSIVSQQGNLNCYEVISEKIVEEANKAGINCNILDCGVVTENDMNTSHTVVQYNDIIIDYTQKQFFGSNDPKDCVPDLINNFKDIDGNVKCYTNDYFTDESGKNINYYYSDLINDLKNHKIIPDTNNYILYLI